YHTVENIVANAGELKGKQKELVEAYGEQAILSKKLATIFTDVPVEFNEEELTYKGPNAEILKPIFNELEFKTISSRVFGDGAARAPKASQLSMFDAAPVAEEIEEDVAGERKNFSESEVSYKILSTIETRRDLIETLKKQRSISVEIVAANLSGDAELYGISFSVAAGTAFFVPVNNQSDARSIVDEFKPLFESDEIKKTGHNLKAVALAFKIFGSELCGAQFDTMLAHYLIEPEASHDLSILCSEYLQYDLLSGGDENMANAACERADKIFQLRDKLQRELEKREHVKLMNDVEMPLSNVLAAMEYEGVKVDVSTLAKMSEELRIESERVQEEIYNMAGTQFNIGSPKQLGEVLFEQMKLIEKPKKTKSGQYATGEDVLLGLSDKHDIVKRILDFREYEKLRSTYVDALPKMISKRDGRIHTDYRQAWAVTGRLSSNNPNLQNIPIRTEKGRAIRKAFVARNDDYRFMSADYSQIELRIAASFAKDKTMIEAFRTGRDIHTTTAARVFNVPVDQVDPNMRRKAKEVNFGILYGSTAFGLAQNLGISRSEAADIINSYFNEFPSIKRYMDESINKARELQYVETILGRRRYLRDINSRNITTRGFAERNAINAPIQGSAADIIKIAMVNIHEWMKKEKLRSRMTMQVHDELVFDVYKDEVDEVKTNVVHLMKTAVELEVPMEVEAGIGMNWLEAH
ncbi:MAG TPA: DNA polymerase I, partial [Cyclobacteriaceae bacterium]|nr:DNA polymerase I [Cyclobacteriaceae bacterium]